MPFVLIEHSYNYISILFDIIKTDRIFIILDEFLQGNPNQFFFFYLFYESLVLYNMDEFKWHFATNTYQVPTNTSRQCPSSHLEIPTPIRHCKAFSFSLKL